MKLLDYKDNINFVRSVFKDHKIFFCKDFPLKFSSFSIGRKESNLETRLSFLFHRFGFFETSIWDKDWEYADENSFKRDEGFTSKDFGHEISKWKDKKIFSHNRRYICQQILDDTIYNPIHTSIKPANDSKIQFDFENPKECWDNFYIVTHPGHTRISCSDFLNIKLNRSLIYVNKKYYYENMFKQKLQEITQVEQLFPLWKPFTDDTDLDLRYSFIKGKDIDFQFRTKFHDKTDCYVLKLWGMWDVSRKTVKNPIGNSTIIAASTYVNEIYKSSSKSSKTLFEKKLQIYTNSTIDVKTYFLDIRKSLLNLAETQIRLKGSWRKNDASFIIDNVDKFDFDVNVVDTKPNNISELNGNKGYAIWIDKDILQDIKRDIYEFIFFTRHDVKLSETKDGKISVVNCGCTFEKKWNIHDEFLNNK